MTREIEGAFESVRGGFSADRVVADPSLNQFYIETCRASGLTHSAIDLNLALLNMRKRAQLRRADRRTVFRDQDLYRFAAEIAIRSLERKHDTTLDRVLCDPERALEFDHVAAGISPGFSSLQYRWAALGLRKRSRLRPELLGRLIHREVIGPITVAEMELTKIPQEQGIYILLNKDRVLYVGEAKSLRARLKKHLDHSDNKDLARYLWESGTEGLRVEYHVLPTETRTNVRKALELEIIRSRRADFNVRR